MTQMPIDETSLQAYVDGALPDARRAEVEAWLADQPEAAERVAAYRRQNQLLLALFNPVLDEPIPDRLLQRSAPKSRFSMMRYAAVVTWVAIGGVIGWGISAWRAGDEMHALARQAAIAHAIYTTEPKRTVEIAANDEPAIVTWLSKRMQMPINVPKLEDVGYRLLGGRLLPSDRGPACQLMYQDAQGKRMTVYMRRDTGRTAMRTVQEEGLRIVTWGDGALAYAVSGSDSESELRRAAESVAKQVRTDAARSPGA